jgi:hypothetical protein
MKKYDQIFGKKYKLVQKLEEGSYGVIYKVESFSEPNKL